MKKKKTQLLGIVLSAAMLARYSICNGLSFKRR